jgi:hypothetical protein
VNTIKSHKRPSQAMRWLCRPRLEWQQMSGGRGGNTAAAAATAASLAAATISATAATPSHLFCGGERRRWAQACVINPRGCGARHQLSLPQRAAKRSMHPPAAAAETHQRGQRSANSLLWRHISAAKHNKWPHSSAAK